MLFKSSNLWNFVMAAPANCHTQIGLTPSKWFIWKIYGTYKDFIKKHRYSIDYYFSAHKRYSLCKKENIIAFQFLYLRYNF